ncbi:MAG TPA: hypothetical protein VGZ00_01150 [Candidatus Baltobacteraceae bacterium]|nr:hypothetical protein [Candidatus Baltobacteraceae bacterium]
MHAPLEADQEIPAARVLFDEERERVLALPQVGTVPDLCRQAEIRCMVTGGPQVGVVLWDGPGHGVTQTMQGQTIYAIEQGALPPNDPERALRIMEVLAFGCFDYVARESVCGRGYFVVGGGKRSEERLTREGHGL